MKTAVNEMQKIDIPFILEAVKETGDMFLAGYKKDKIPQTKEAVMTIFNSIEERCLAMLKKKITPKHPDIVWAEGGEFDMNEQKAPLDIPEYWLCDSMDGAIQYIQHIPGWTINLVLIRNNQPHFAVVYDPLANEMFWAQQGHGAFMNNEPIKPSVKDEASMMLSTFDHPPLSKSVDGLHSRIGHAVETLLDQFGAVRNYGPHGLQLAWTAAGRIDIFCQEGLDTYNWLPGILIAHEAGAKILTTQGREWQWGDDSLLVAAPAVIEHHFKK